MISWLPRAGSRGPMSLRLFCFPYAGGGASTYRGWGESLAAIAQVVPVELPGRGARLKESPHRHVETLVTALSDEMLPLLDLPFAFFGHSMGGLIAYELARRLETLHLPRPVHLFVSASRAPHRWDEPPLHTLSDTELVEELRRMNGTPAEVLENTELMELLLPTLRADFELCESYRYKPGGPLSTPMTVFGGSEDQHISRDDLRGWDIHTSAGMTLIEIAGDHFFLHTAEGELLRRLAMILAPLAGRVGKETRR